MTIYTISYYEEDEQFGGTLTLKDYVYSKTEEKALEKFDKKHPNTKVRFVSNWITADY